MNALMALLVIAAVAGFWLVFTYNNLISLRNHVLNAFRQIDVQLKRRRDLIPNLVSSVKGYMKFESDTLEKVIAARQQAIAVPAGDVRQLAEKEGLLTQALTRFLAVVERYPDLKASANVKVLMEELTHTENQISFARQFYNDLSTQYNTSQQSFPTNLIASSFGFSPVELFELPAGSPEREVPTVDLGAH